MADKTKQELVNIIVEINPCLEQCYTRAFVNNIGKSELLKDAEKYANEFNLKARLWRIESVSQHNDHFVCFFCFLVFFFFGFGFNYPHVFVLDLFFKLYFDFLIEKQTICYVC